MKEVVPPKPNILIVRYKKPQKFCFFDKYYVAPHGYSLVTMAQGQDIKSLPRIGGKVSGSNAIYLLKMNFDISWGVINLTCMMENNVLSHEFGFSGIVSLEVDSPEEFYSKINVANTTKVLVEDFKKHWMRHWGDLLKRTFSNRTIGYREVPQVVESLKSSINAEMIDTYRVAVAQISIGNMSKV